MLFYRYRSGNPVTHNHPARRGEKTAVYTAVHEDFRDRAATQPAPPRIHILTDTGRMTARRGTASK